MTDCLSAAGAAVNSIPRPPSAKHGTRTGKRVTFAPMVTVREIQLCLTPGALERRRLGLLRRV